MIGIRNVDSSDYPEIIVIRRWQFDVPVLDISLVTPNQIFLLQTVPLGDRHLKDLILNEFKALKVTQAKED